ncbi:MAG: hypothetical protein NNA31_01305 [Nitrospira sp.]|nr:hypothetical protein [Nitrospira sp.]
MRDNHHLAEPASRHEVRVRAKSEEIDEREEKRRTNSTALIEAVMSFREGNTVVTQQVTVQT